MCGRWSLRISILAVRTSAPARRNQPSRHISFPIMCKSHAKVHDAAAADEETPPGQGREDVEQGEGSKPQHADCTTERDRTETSISPAATSLRSPWSRGTSLIRGLFRGCGHELTTPQECLFLCLTFGSMVALTAYLTRLTIGDRMNADAAGARDSEVNCAVDLGRYEGPVYGGADQSAEKVASKCLVQSPSMRVTERSVNSDGESVGPWLWIDRHDQINVLVESPDSSEEDPVFMVLSRTNFGLPSSSLAVVGGIVEPDEGGDALGAARRRVSEELGVICRDWSSLGRYRADVDRGMGWVHPFISRDCAYSRRLEADAADGYADGAVGARDTEKREVRHMKLADVHAAALRGEFVEVQWSNTVSLALLSLAEFGRSRSQYLPDEGNTRR